MLILKIIPGGRERGIGLRRLFCLLLHFYSFCQDKYVLFSLFLSHLQVALDSFPTEIAKFSNKTPPVSEGLQLLKLFYSFATCRQKQVVVEYL